MSYSTKTSLAAICDVQSGYTARTGLTPTPDGVAAVQLRDLRGEADFDPATAETYPLGPSLERYEVGAGDILFRSRGDRNTAVLVTPTSDRKAVAIQPLTVLRPRQDIVDPRYLAWYINQPMTQRYFDGCAHGTAMRMIPRVSLDTLEIPLPDLPTQKLIVELDALARREQALAHQLADKKMELTRFALLAQVRKAQPHGNEAGRLTARQVAKPGEQVGTDKLRR